MPNQINRRMVLRGAAGAALSLPWLESMGLSDGRRGKTQYAPKRLVATGVYYGMMPDYFHPRETGSHYQTPRLIQPLERHRKDFTIFSGLDHNLNGGHSATKYFLNGIPTNQAKGYKDANISLDQKAAELIGQHTRYPSLVLGCETSLDNALSWTRHGGMIPINQSIRKLYHQLFGTESAASTQKMEARLKDRQSVLDLVGERAKAFKQGLSTKDADKLDQYFTSVRELEIKMNRASKWLYDRKPETKYKVAGHVDQLPLNQRVPIFYDLMVLALQTDSTRVITLSLKELGKDHGGLQGVTGHYHALSHHGKEQKTKDELAQIERFHTQQLARFLDKLKKVAEPNGKTLFDSTLTLFGSGMSNGNSHSTRDLPVILAGGGFKHGEHKHYDKQRRRSVPLCNLYLSMLQHLADRKQAQSLDQFNTSSGTLTGMEVA